MIIAGYITATTVDLVRVGTGSSSGKLFNLERYLNSEHSKFDSILKLYLKKLKGEVDYACLGVAGPVINNQVDATNIPWHISAQALEKKFSIKTVKILNDLSSD